MRRVIVPATPGVLSAYGGIIADVRNDFIQTPTPTWNVTVSLTAASRTASKHCATGALHWLKVEHGSDGEAIPDGLRRFALPRQSYEIDTPLEATWIEDANISAVAEAFHREHARIYEHADETAPLQIINLG